MPPRRLLPRVALALAAAIPAPATARAQVRASEAASVSQTVDGTKITIEYSRPRGRARDSLFGKVVPWGEVWTPGANLATTLEVTKDVRVNGHALSKGKYSVWMVVRPETVWTVVLDPRAQRYHTERPDSTPEQVRFPVHRSERPFNEVLTWSFPAVRTDGVTLAMHWGTSYVPFDIEVKPTYLLPFPAQQAAAYVGQYSWAWNGPPPDTAMKPMTLTVTYENDKLMGRWEPAPFPEWDSFALIRIADNWFIPGFLLKGELWEVAREMVLEFSVRAGRATAFEVRDETDKLMATGKRKP
jgi:hypothetical protein